MTRVGETAVGDRHLLPTMTPMIVMMKWTSLPCAPSSERSCKKLSSRSTPEPRRSERGDREGPRDRARASGSAAQPQGSAQSLSSCSKCCSNGGCGPWHRSTGWVSRAREAAQPPGWVCKAHLPSAQRRGALLGRVRAHMPSRRFRARSSIVVPVLCLSFLSCRFLFYSFLLSS